MRLKEDERDGVEMEFKGEEKGEGHWKQVEDFPGGLMAKIPHSQCRGLGFDSWSGN